MENHWWLRTYEYKELGRTGVAGDVVPSVWHLRDAPHLNTWSTLFHLVSMALMDQTFYIINYWLHYTFRIYLDTKRSSKKYFLSQILLFIKTKHMFTAHLGEILKSTKNHWVIVECRENTCIREQSSKIYCIVIELTF